MPRADPTMPEPEPEKRSVWRVWGSRVKNVGVWTVGTIAAIALLLSNIDTIRTKLKSLFGPPQTYRASILIHEIPIVSVLDQNTLAVAGELSFTLLNSGTGPVVIRNIEMVVTQKREPGKGPCRDPFSESFATAGDPIVLKPNDVIAKKQALKPAGGPKQTVVGDKIQFATRPGVMIESGLIVQVCFQVDASTPDASSIVTDIDYGDFDIDRRQSYMGHSRNVEYKDAIPIVH